MHSSLSTITSLLLATSVASHAIERSNPFKSTSGFSNPEFSFSAGGHATCISGLITIPVTTNTTKILFNPSNQYEVTAAFFQYLQAGNNQSTALNGGTVAISQSFKIAAKLCYPKSLSGSSNPSTIQVLTHGINFDGAYWDFEKGYSFIDVAAQNGYPTLAFDRLGVGNSERPDPIQVVQVPTQVEILHGIVSALRAGKLVGQSFKNVIGVGHSLGSIQTVGVAAAYPKDFDAVVLTGFSTNASAVPFVFADFNPTIASQGSPDRFRGLANGYFVFNNQISDLTAHWAYPFYDPAVFQTADAAKQTFTFGEVFTLASVVRPSPSFTGPVDVVIGEWDFPFSHGNANYPTNQAVPVQPTLFPNASNGSRSLIVKDAGHIVNLHYNAPLLFNQVQEFVKDNGF